MEEDRTKRKSFINGKCLENCANLAIVDWNFNGHAMVVRNPFGPPPQCTKESGNHAKHNFKVFSLQEKAEKLSSPANLLRGNSDHSTALAFQLD